MKAQTLEEGLVALVQSPQGAGLVNTLRDAQRHGKSLVIFYASDMSRPESTGAHKTPACAISASPTLRLDEKNAKKEDLWQKRCHAAAPTEGEYVYRSLKKEGRSKHEALSAISALELYRSPVYWL